jgi:hypothetical protein
MSQLVFGCYSSSQGMSFLVLHRIFSQSVGRLAMAVPRQPKLPFISLGSNRLLVQSFATKGKGSKAKGPVVVAAKVESSALQHQEWVKFQQSIAVEGFETGQTTTLQSTKKTRGGKAVQRQKTKRDVMADKLQERRRLTGAGGGEFPPLRYSDEETERLLAQAYAALPVRTGRRGTKNLKRQKRRWHLVREIHRKYKAHMAKFQIRKMEKRARKMKEVKAVLASAPDIRARDQEYQVSIYQRWAATMVVDQGDTTATTGLTSESSTQTQQHSTM